MRTRRPRLSFCRRLEKASEIADEDRLPDVIIMRLSDSSCRCLSREDMSYRKQLYTLVHFSFKPTCASSKACENLQMRCTNELAVFL
jgi:hypothetical protein